jgi:hypothetical protein
MRNRYCHLGVPVLLVGGALTGITSAQSSEPACSMGINNFVGYGGMNKNNLAYTATVKTTFEQRLPDGNEIRGYMYTHQAQDSAGRSMSEMGHGCRLDENGVPQPQFGVSVYDPTTKTTLFWDVGVDREKVVRVSHPHDIPRKTLTPAELAATRKAHELRQSSARESQSEDLGIRTIAGVEAHGSRTTTTIPAGEVGNKLPIVTTDEIWRSKEFGLVVLAIRDDPRRGRTTYEVEQLSRTEPDPSVFAPPEGYRIEDPESLSGPGSQP